MFCVRFWCALYAQHCLFCLPCRSSDDRAIERACVYARLYTCAVSLVVVVVFDGACECLRFARGCLRTRVCQYVRFRGACAIKPRKVNIQVFLFIVLCVCVYGWLVGIVFVVGLYIGEDKVHRIAKPDIVIDPFIRPIASIRNSNEPVITIGQPALTSVQSSTLAGLHDRANFSQRLPIRLYSTYPKFGAWCWRGPTRCPIFYFANTRKNVQMQIECIVRKSIYT